MNLTAVIPEGVTELTVNGLTQWDYGRRLEIHADDLPALVEVHFSCPSMQDAIVRVGSAANGSVAVTIPDQCLEQSLPITAWVYEIGETSGKTIKTLTLNVQARKRPQTVESLDPENYDKYTEAVGAMNEAVETLQRGDIKVKDADHADTADTAGTASVANKASGLSCVEINSLDDLDAAVVRHETFGVFFAKAWRDIPEGSKGIVSRTILSDQSYEAILNVVDRRGTVRTSYRTNGDWGKIREIGETLSVTTYPTNLTTQNREIEVPGIYVVRTKCGNTFVICIPRLTEASQSGRTQHPDDSGAYEYITYADSLIKYNITKAIEAPRSIESVVCIAAFI